TTSMRSRTPGARSWSTGRPCGVLRCGESGICCPIGRRRGRGGGAAERARNGPAPARRSYNGGMDKHYDREYFDHWYRRGGIGGAQRLARKVALAVATAEYHLERPVRSVLDIGCGEGAWRTPLLKLRPKARYLGFDASEYAIAR